jgi:hypothetical protein
LQCIGGGAGVGERPGRRRFGFAVFVLKCLQGKYANEELKISA